MKHRIWAAFMGGFLSLMAPALAQPAKLTIWLVGDEKGVRTLQPAVDAFKIKRPGAIVEVRTVPWTDAMTKYSAAIASRSGPDLLTGGLSYGIELGAKGGLVDLTKKAPDLVAQLEKVGHPGLLRSIRARNGALYAMPYDATVQLLYHRTDLVPKAPTTWEAFKTEVVKQRAAGNKGYAQQWGNLSWIGFFPYLYQAGGSLYDAACTRSTVDSPEAIKALTYYASLYTELKIPSDTWPDIETGLESGAMPMAQTHNHAMPAMDISRKKMAGKWTIAKLPAGPSGKGTAFMGGTVMGVTQFSPNVDLAVEFLRVVYTPEVLQAMVEAALKQGVLWLPGARPELIEKSSMPADRKQVLLQQFREAEGPPNCPGWQRMDTVMARAIQQVVVSKADPKVALTAAADKMTRALSGK